MYRKGKAPIAVLSSTRPFSFAVLKKGPNICALHIIGSKRVSNSLESCFGVRPVFRFDPVQKPRALIQISRSALKHQLASSGFLMTLKQEQQPIKTFCGQLTCADIQAPCTLCSVRCTEHLLWHQRAFPSPRRLCKKISLSGIVQIIKRQQGRLASITQHIRQSCCAHGYLDSRLN